MFESKETINEHLNRYCKILKDFKWTENGDEWRVKHFRPSDTYIVTMKNGNIESIEVR